MHIVCPYCIEIHNLYDEAEFTPEEIQEIQHDIENSEYSDLDFICCVNNCQNGNALDITLKASKCKLID